MAHHVQCKNVGIIGYGHLGEFLTEELEKLDGYNVKDVWNRTIDCDDGKGKKRSIRPLEDLYSEELLKDIDLMIEVAHPNVIQKYGSTLLKNSNLFIGSPTGLADEVTYKSIEDAAAKYGRSVFVPAGAFWGGQDVQKMADFDTLASLTVTMTKHPSSFRLESPLKELNEEALKSQRLTVLYEGPVRQLCPLAPNNVNTMAGAAVAAHTLGFDQVYARLISDPNESRHHIVTVDVVGKNGFHCLTVRKNPATVGAVTGSATYNSFLASIKATDNKPPGLQVC